MQTIVMGKRGTVVVPAKLRKRYLLDEGSPMVVEEHEDGIMLRPAKVSVSEPEVYTPERLAEFFLNNAMDAEDYQQARKEVVALGIDPDSIDHIRWPQ